MAINDDIIDAYRDQLGREPTADEVSSAIARVGGGTSLTDLEQSLNRSLEGQNFDTQYLSSQYRQLFARNPEQEGYQYWLSQMQQDPNRDAEATRQYLIDAASAMDAEAYARSGSAPLIPGGYTQFTGADVQADPYSGRYATTSIYDLAPDAVNASDIYGTRAQFVNPLNEAAVISNISGEGVFQAGQGLDVLNNDVVNATINRALNSGAMSREELGQLTTDLRAAKSMDDVRSAFGKPQATVILDAQYGLQTGQGNTVAQAQERAKDMQAVLNALDSQYYPSNMGVVAPAAAAANVPYAFGPNAYQGYDTMMTQKDVITPANFNQRINEVATGISGLRPTYGTYQFNRARPEVTVPEVYSDRDLLGNRAPGGIDLTAVAQQAPEIFGGVASLPARPATNTSVPEGMAEPIVEGIMANQASVPVSMAKGGEVPAQGIKSLAKSLPQYGRYNDDMVAHISSEEAALLESLGGAGTINPYTGLPEYGVGSFLQKTVVRPAKKVVKAAVKPVKEVVQKLGPVGQIAATYFGGPMGAALYGGLASEGKFFDLKRGIMSGITAYGASQLGAGLEAAGGAPVPGPEAIVPTELGIAGTDLVGSEVARTGLTEPAMSFTDKLGNMASTAYDKTASGLSSLGDASTYTNLGTDLANKASAIPDRLGNVGQGIANLASGDPAALEAFKGSGATLMNTAAPILMGTTGQAAIDEMDKMKREQQIILDEKERRRKAAADRAYTAMSATPWNFAEGGMASFDDSAGVDGLTSLGSPIIAKYNAGGQPRFLSGGGDGMSDSIKASIEDKQEARLADGEFVIPADVVSHIGNGSSKAGAKRLYSMMDRVRKARTGNPKQGKEINAMQYLPA